MAENKLLIRILADNKQAKTQLGQLEASLEKMRGALQRVGHYGAIVFSGWQVGGAAAEVVRLTESMNALQARLRIVTASARDFAEAQRGVLDISRRLGTDFAGTGQLFVRTFNAIKTSGGTIKEALNVTETVSAALKLGGATAAESSSAMLQFSQAMGAGVLRGEELNAVMEASPPLAQALADGLGVPIGELKKLGEQGVLTSDLVRRALLEQADDIKKQSALLPTTIGQGFSAFRTSMAQTLAEVDRFLGVTRGIGNAFRAMGENIAPVAAIIGGLLAAAMANVSRLAYAAAAAFFAKARASQQAAVAAGMNATAMAGEAAAAVAAGGAAAAAGTKAGVARGAVGLLGRAIGLLGGPVGVGITLLVSLGSYFLSLGSQAEAAAESVEQQMDRIRRATQDTGKRFKPGEAAALQAQLDAAKDKLAETVNQPLEKGLLENAAIKRKNAAIAEQVRLVTLLANKVRDAENAPRTGAALELAKNQVAGFLAGYQSKREQLEDELKRFRELAKNARLTESEVRAGEAKIIANSKNKSPAAQIPKVRTNDVNREAEREADALLRAQTELQKNLAEAEAQGLADQLDARKELLDLRRRAELVDEEAFIREKLRLDEEGLRNELAALEAQQAKLRAASQDKNAKGSERTQALADLALVDARIASTGQKILNLNQAAGFALADAQANRLKAEFDAVQKQIDAQLAALRDKEQALKNQVDLGLPQAAAEAQINAARRDTLATTTDLVTKLEELARLNPQLFGTEALAQIARYKTGIAELEVVVDSVATRINSAVSTAFEKLFSDIGSGAATASDAMRAFLSSIVAEVNAVVGKNLAQSILGSILPTGQAGATGGLGGFISGILGTGTGGKPDGTPGNPISVTQAAPLALDTAGLNAEGGLFGQLRGQLGTLFDGLKSGFSGLFSGLGNALSGLFSGGGGGGGLGSLFSGLFSLFGFASGGYTGDGGKYQPAGVVHRGEYVFPADAVRSLGVNALASLQHFATGAFVPSMPRLSYADGGLVNLPQQAAPTVNSSTRIVNLFDPSQVAGQLGQTREFERAVLNVIQLNPSVLR